MKKNSCTPINPKKYSCHVLKKIHTRNLITKKNSLATALLLPLCDQARPWFRFSTRTSSVAGFALEEEGKEKKFMQKEGQLWLFHEVWVSFRKSEFQKSTILPGTIWIKKNHFLLIERRQLEPYFCLKLQLVYVQHTLYTVL